MDMLLDIEWDSSVIAKLPSTLTHLALFNHDTLRELPALDLGALLPQHLVHLDLTLFRMDLLPAYTRLPKTLTSLSVVVGNNNVPIWALLQLLPPSSLLALDIGTTDISTDSESMMELFKAVPRGVTRLRLRRTSAHSIAKLEPSPFRFCRQDFSRYISWQNCVHWMPS